MKKAVTFPVVHAVLRRMLLKFKKCARLFIQSGMQKAGTFFFFSLRNEFLHQVFDFPCLENVKCEQPAMLPEAGS